MKRDLLEKGIVISIMLLLTGAFFVPVISGDINYKTEPVSITINQIDDNIELIYEINDFEEILVNINGFEYSKIIIGEESNPLLLGKPDIPSICRSIAIPDTAKMEIEIVNSDYEEFDNILIAPSKGDILKCVNPEDVPYEFGDVYNEDVWYPSEIASLREPYILRDYRGQVVDIYPIQYNPVQKIMRFYNNIEVNIYPDGIDTINIINRESLPEKVESNYNFIYNNHFINFGISSRYDPVSEQGNMLVITYDDFWDEMEPLVEWKNMKGIPTEMVEVSTIGDAAAIKTYIADYYDDYGLTFVLLVGDAAQVPTLYTSPYTSAASDPSYSFIAGSDNYQDLFVGRFSAQNSGDLETQVERTLEYEKYPQSSADWYHKGTGVASNQGPGDDGEYDDEHIDNIRDDLLAYTYTEVDQIYDPSGTTAMITAAVNDGRSIINYCGHGSPTSWSNGGGFSNSDVNTLVNDNMLPFICSVACNNGQFDDYEPCFAEAWLRATNSGEPTGAIGMFASSQSQSWDPPMDAEDEIIDILVETYENNIRTTYGALCFQGTMHMMDEYGSSCYDETDSWTVFGDPSLQVRTDTPTDMEVDHDEMISIGSETFELDVTGVENALCAISFEYELLGYGYTDEDGHAVIDFFEPIEFMEGADLVVTAYNKNPYITTVMVGSSYPPEPPTIDGPTVGRINKEYEYTATTTDPEGDQILYMFDWGDGTQSEWIGPVISGESVSASHAWSEIGDYEVKARAKDVEDSRSKWTSYPIQMDVPNLNFGVIKGGLFRITATIKNEGIAEADDINWEISLEGGNIFLGRTSTGTITDIPAGGETTVTSNLIIGIGDVKVKVTVDGPECSASSSRGGKVYFVFIKINPGGGD